MSAVTTGPFAVPPPPATGGGKAIQLGLPQQSPQQAVVIDNISPYPMVVTIAGQQFWLSQWMENVYYLDTSRQPVTVTPFAAGAGVPAGTGTVLATWYAPGDAVPGGTWPMSLTADAISAGITSYDTVITSTGLTVLANPVSCDGTANTAVLPSAGGPYRIYGWGVYTWPGVTAPVFSTPVNAQSGGAGSELVFDALNVTNGEQWSQRPNGLLVPGFWVNNQTANTLDVGCVYSLA